MMTDNVASLEYAKDLLAEWSDNSSDPDQDAGIVNLRWLIGEIERLRAGFRLALARLDRGLSRSCFDNEIEAYMKAAEAAGGNDG